MSGAWSRSCRWQTRAQTGNDANDRRAIEGGDTLPQDPAVGVDCHRLKRLAKRHPKELNSPARCRQIHHAHNLRQTSTNPIQIAITYRSELCNCRVKRFMKLL